MQLNNKDLIMFTENRCDITSKEWPNQFLLIAHIYNNSFLTVYLQHATLCREGNFGEEKNKLETELKL